MMKASQKKELVKKALLAKGWYEDKWGNLLHNSHPGIRYKFGERNLKKQAKYPKDCGSGWYSIRSTPYGKFSSEKLEKICNTVGV